MWIMRSRHARTASSYSYAGSNPIGHMDSTGLLEQCRAGLDAINGNDFGPLHHEFTCWKGADGKEVCRSSGRDQMSSIAKAVLGKVNGRILKDDENKTENSTSCALPTEPWVDSTTFFGP